MILEEQSEIRKILANTKLPKFALVKQHFPDDAIKDVPKYLNDKLADPEIRSRIKPGMTVVLTGSSREIDNMPVILRELARFIKAQGANPYIVPAMGSHGGATDEGQKELLEGYGITEEFCECPIYSSMETVRVGYVDDDEVRMDKFAHDADAIILVGRIKGHTAFRGTYESGMSKMMAIGLGKREGADSLHKYGFGRLGERIPKFARVVYEHCNVVFGVAPIENESDRTCRIELIKAEELAEFRQDIVTSYDKLYKYTGDVNVDGRPALTRFFRPPTLAVSKAGISTVFDVGFTYCISGDMSTDDYKAKDYDDMLKQLAKGISDGGDFIKVRDGSVIVMHMLENARYTAQALDTMIPIWQSQGYSFARLDDYLQ